MSPINGSKLANNFSLVLGGPLFQFFICARINTDTLGLLKRRVVVISLFTWFPLLLFSVFSGEVLGSESKVPFFYDLDVHLRFLVALPLLLIAELIVHLRIRPIVWQFIDRGIISKRDRPEFEGIVASALSLRNSMVIEILLIILVLTTGHYLWSSQLALEAATWYASVVEGEHRFTLAGYWYVYRASLKIVPIFPNL